MTDSGSSRPSSGPPRERSRSRFSAALARPAAAGFGAFVVGAVLSAALAWFVGQSWQDATTARFARRTGTVSANLQRELQAGAAVLTGARGLLQASPGLSPDAWRAYVSGLDLDYARAPLRALGYASAGSTASPSAATIALFAPVAHGAAPELPAQDAEALQRAADTGQIAFAAHPSHPAPDAAGGAAPALTLYLPVYRDPAPANTAARRGALAGFLFAPLDTARAFELATEEDRNLGLQAYAAPPGAPLYATDMPPDEAPIAHSRYRRTDTLHFGGDTLTLAYTAFDTTGGARTLASLVLAAGLIASLSLAAAMAGWSRARAAARAVPSGSRLNEARMMGIIRSSMEAIITVDEDQKVVIFNPMAEKVFGVSAMDAIGAPLTRFIPPRFRPAHGQHIARFGVTGQSERHLGSQRLLYGLRANGDEFPIEASISQIHDGAGKLYTVMMRDVTERLQAENALKASREELRELSANLQRVREEEKTRIARELHDDLGQQLTALKMDLSAVEHRLLRNSSPEAHESVDEPLREMRRLIDATVASVRRIAADLRPVMLDDLGLVPAIEWLVNDFTHRYGIDVERRIEPGDLEFSNASATALFRIVQEALTNVARHADATRVELALTVDEHQCVLRIADDGVGATHTDVRRAPDDKSFGLLGIRERAHMLGGAVRIETARDQGYALTITIPLPSIQQDPNLP
ncbi:PAS domain S-box protein [Burkholderia sp. 22PA0106]|uniref:PAS domain S-box protein n=1 Tax=Burkholderia sp. 22PA0106 TaxID=3237371 RepID=UPI0039C2E58B